MVSEKNKKRSKDNQKQSEKLTLLNESINPKLGINHEDILYLLNEGIFHATLDDVNFGFSCLKLKYIQK